MSSHFHATQRSHNNEASCEVPGKGTFFSQLVYGILTTPPSWFWHFILIDVETESQRLRHLSHDPRGTWEGSELASDTHLPHIKGGNSWSFLKQCSENTPNWFWLAWGWGKSSWHLHLPSTTHICQGNISCPGTLCRVLQLDCISLWEPTAKFLGIWGATWHHVDSLKLTPMGIFIPKKSANASNQDTLFPQKDNY